MTARAPTLTRRAFLAAGGAAAGGLAFASWFGALARAASGAPARGGRARSLVLVWLAGGPSHLDTFDAKPDPVMGGRRAIDTALPGVRFADTLPLLAARLGRAAVVRSLRHTVGEHDRGAYFAHTGYVPVPATSHPSVGAVLAHARPGDDPALPAYVTIGGTPRGAGFLGSAYEPFALVDAMAPPAFLRPPVRVDAARDAERMALLERLDAGAAEARPGTLAADHAVLARRAHGVAAGPLPAALDLSGEGAARERYGKDALGAACLTARRLVQAGVRAVEVSLPGWDTHEDNLPRTGALAAVLDRGLSALLDDLQATKLLASTLVVCMGEFGRTPALNARGGREHHPAAYAALLAGGGIRPGTALGRTDDRGDKVVERPVSVPDLLATIYTCAGVDPDRILPGPGGRPIDVAPDGKVIEELLG